MPVHPGRLRNTPRPPSLRLVLNRSCPCEELGVNWPPTHAGRTGGELRPALLDILRTVT